MHSQSVMHFPCIFIVFLHSHVFFMHVLHFLLIFMHCVCISCVVYAFSHITTHSMDPPPCHTADGGDVLINTVMCAYPTQAGPDHYTAVGGSQPGHPAFVARTPTLVWLQWYDWGPDGFAIVPPASAEGRAHYGIGFVFGPTVSDPRSRTRGFSARHHARQ